MNPSSLRVCFWVAVGLGIPACAHREAGAGAALFRYGFEESRGRLSGKNSFFILASPDPEGTSVKEGRLKFRGENSADFVPAFLVTVSERGLETIHSFREAPLPLHCQGSAGLAKVCLRLLRADDAKSLPPKIFDRADRGP